MDSRKTLKYLQDLDKVLKYHLKKDAISTSDLPIVMLFSQRYPLEKATSQYLIKRTLNSIHKFNMVEMSLAIRTAIELEEDEKNLRIFKNKVENYISVTNVKLLKNNGLLGIIDLFVAFD